MKCIYIYTGTYYRLSWYYDMIHTLFTSIKCLLNNIHNLQTFLIIIDVIAVRFFFFKHSSLSIHPTNCSVQNSQKPEKYLDWIKLDMAPINIRFRCLYDCLHLPRQSCVWWTTPIHVSVIVNMILRFPLAAQLLLVIDYYYFFCMFISISCQISSIFFLWKTVTSRGCYLWQLQLPIVLPITSHGRFTFWSEEHERLFFSLSNISRIEHSNTRSYCIFRRTTVFFSV